MLGSARRAVCGGPNRTHRIELNTRNIFLIGLMGSGKTTVGRALAKKLNKRFVDTDHEIEARTGATVALIFEIEGEEMFRRREAEVIREMTALDGVVLATGGGAVLHAPSRALLAARGTVVYLRASVSSILQRTSHDKNRPLLQTADPRRRIEELARQREPLYAEIAHIVIDTGRPNVQFLAQCILAELAARAALSEPDSIIANQPISDMSAESHTDFSAGPDTAAAASVTSMRAQSSAATMRAVLQVDLGARSYPIVIGPGVLREAEWITRYVRGSSAAIVTNTVVAPLYLAGLQQALASAGKQTTTVILPDGEGHKNWSQLMTIFDALLTNQCDRKTTLIALGGGVVGDMTGFAAASYQRGVPFIQIPTTLLAQVDSSVGGKTGINHPLGKNMIGAFYQPQAVLADLDTLRTLPARELSAGLAEVIKYGAVIDATFFAWLEQNIDALLAGDVAALAYAVRRSCEIKAEVVRQDEREGGLRALLNFGHTFGHAIEACMGYGAWLHGEAVGCGMVMAAELSLRVGTIDAAQKARVVALVHRAGLPTIAPDLGLERWIAAMEVDKKNDGGEIRFILMRPLGGGLITPVPRTLLEASIAACL